MAKDSLERRQLLKNDEVYTSYSQMVELDQAVVLTNHLRGRRILCPCDSDVSEIYLYLKGLDLNVTCDTSDFRKQDWCDYGTIITNPPFSLIREFNQKVKGKNFLFVSPLTNLLRFHYGSKEIKEPFKNADLKNCVWVSNFINLRQKRIRKVFPASQVICDQGYVVCKKVGEVIEVSRKVNEFLVPSTFLLYQESLDYSIVKEVRPTINGKPLFSKLLVKVK